VTKTFTINKGNQAALSITSGNEVVFGNDLALSATGGSTNGTVTYTVTNGTGRASVSGAVLTATQAGTVTVTATKAGDNNYNDVTSAPVTITISKATPTGAPSYTTLTSAGLTLASAGLSADSFAVPGTLIWVDENGEELDSGTTVVANQSYTWQFTPDDTNNYEVQTGSVVLYYYVAPATSTETETVGTTTIRHPGGSTNTDNADASTGTETGGSDTTDTPTNGGSTGEWTDASVQFNDVAPTAWYHEAVSYVSNNGLMQGTGEGFSPESNMNRAMLMTVLARMAGADTEGGSPWYAKAMAWAKTNNISDGNAPTEDITREQVVTMLYRYMGQPSGSTSLAAYPDSGEISSWASDAMSWAVSVGLISGSDGKLNPTGTATRAELATMLMRFVDNVL
jgi:hypothetical protein